MRKLGFLIVCFMVLAFSVFSAEPAANGEIIDNLVDQFVGEAAKIEDKMFVSGKFLFWSLALLGFVWQWIPVAASGFKTDLGDTFSNLARWIITTGLFWAFFIDAPYLAELIINSFMKIGVGAGAGFSDSANFLPSNILTKSLTIFWIGFDTLTYAYSNFPKGISGIAPGLLYVGVTIIIVFICALAGIIVSMIAIEAALTLIEANLFASIAMIVAAFGSATWTREWAIAYFKQIIGIGLHIMTLILLVGVGMNIMETQVQQLGIEDMVKMWRGLRKFSALP